MKQTKKRWAPKTSRKVPPTETLPVRTMFDRLAPQYDRFNQFASLGLHHLWRRNLISRIPKGARVLDVATGTGDVALAAYRAGHTAVGVDFSENMIQLARAKDAKQHVKWVVGNAEKLPFSDRSFQCVTSAFALRNFGEGVQRVLKECARVLQVGGKTLHLDFGRPTSPILKWGHQLHLGYGIEFVGRQICGENWPKKYLETTIQKFYEPHELESHMRVAGFTNVKHTSLFGGTVRLYEGVKC